MSKQVSARGEAAPSRVISAALRSRIESGEVAPGDKLPSERFLMNKYNVARNTARDGIRMLVDEGLVEAQPGRGYYVRGTPRLMRWGAERYGRALRKRTGLSPYRAEAAAQGRVPRVDCVSITIEPAPAEICDRLGLPSGSEVVRRENWYYADDQPVQVGVTYIPVSIAVGTPMASAANMGPGSLYARLEEQGYVVHKTREEVSARAANPDEKAELEVPPGVPVLDLTHTSLDERGRPFEVTHFVMRADQAGVDYLIDVPNHDNDSSAVMVRQPRHEPELAAVLRRVYEADGYPVEGIAEPIAWLHTPQQLRSWTALVAGKPVGHVTLFKASSEDDAATLWLEQERGDIEDLALVGRLFVDPSARRLGLATKLMKTAIQYAHTRGLAVAFDVVEKDTAAMSLYEGMGCEQIGTVTHRYSGDTIAARVYVVPPQTMP